MAEIERTPEDAAEWQRRWNLANERDRQIRADRIRDIDWDRDWPWIDAVLSLGAQFAAPRLPTSLIQYRTRLAKVRQL